MSISSTLDNRQYRHARRDRVAALPLDADAGLSRSEALELFAVVDTLEARFEVVEAQMIEYRTRLEDEGLLRR